MRPVPLPDTTAGFARTFAALRRAGDTDGAIALVDRLFAERAQDGLPAAVGGELFRTVALERTLPPALFRHLVDRFGWRDPAGPAARDDADRHAVLLARVDAEDWFAALAAAAAKPGNPVAAAVLARPAGPAPVPVLDAAEKAEARATMDGLLARGQFLLDRLDARGLAALRQAVEGAPLAANPALTRRTLLPRRVARLRQRLGWSGQLALGLVAVGLAWGLWGAGGMMRPYRPPPGDVQARQILDMAPESWVTLRPMGRDTLVYFTSLVTSRAALRGVRYGLDSPVPDREFALPPAPPGPPAWPQPIERGTPIYVTVPGRLGFVSVALTYADGTTSPVRTFEVGETKR